MGSDRVDPVRRVDRDLDTRAILRREEEFRRSLGREGSDRRPARGLDDNGITSRYSTGHERYSALAHAISPQLKHGHCPSAGPWCDELAPAGSSDGG